MKPVFSDYRLSVGVQQGSEAAAVAAVHKKIVHSGFLVNDDDGVGRETDAFPFFDVESVFSHIAKN